MSPKATAVDYSEERCVRPNPVLRSLLRHNPLDVVARLATAEHYGAERVGADEVHIQVPGFWCDYTLTFKWDKDAEQLGLAIVFDGRLVGGRGDDIFRLLGLLNEQLGAGHFDFWAKTRSLVYRQAVSLAGGAELRIEQAMALVAGALDAAERGHPAFQYVIWAGNSPEEALERVADDLLGAG